MRLSLVQYTAEPSVSVSESRVFPLMREAVAAGAQVIVLPECALFLSTRQSASREAALSIDSAPVARLAQFAKQHAVWLVVGSLTLRIEDMIRNRCLVFDPHGQLIQSYDKIHLFDVQLASGESYRESALFCAGKSPAMVEIAQVPVGLSICFDLRFPKLFRHYASQGAGLVLVPAAFTKTTGEAHWHTLLRARAIENGLFVAAAAQCGITEEGRETFGHSVVYDPWGACLGQLDVAPGVLTVDLELAAVERARSQIPVLSQDRDF